tara:strand:- start:4734 stop:5228 length:495 start_codon:yes stop_codon:yes gene_type:complete
MSQPKYLKKCAGSCSNINPFVERFKNEIEVAPVLDYGGNSIEWSNLDREKRIEFIQKFMESSSLAGIVTHPDFRNLAARYKDAIEGEYDSLYNFDGADFKKSDVPHMLIAVNAEEALFPQSKLGGRRRRRTRRKKKRKSRRRRRKRTKKKRRRKSRKSRRRRRR